MSANSNNSFSRSPDNFKSEFLQLEDLFYDLKQVGKGSYGSVYVARYRSNGKNVAVKLMKLEQNTGLETIVQDMCMVKNIHSRYIVRILENLIISYEEVKYFCVVMEKYDTNLYQYSTRNHGYNEKNIEIMFRMALAVRECAIRNIIHSDIKPENFLIRGNKVVLADFGLAQPNACSSGTLLDQVYTQPYRPPEVFFELGYNLKADIWALACSFYDLLEDDDIFGVEPIAMLDNMFEALGHPKDEFPEIVTSKAEIYDEEENVDVKLYVLLSELGHPNDWRYQKLHDNEQMNDLFHNMLKLNPKNRFNIDQVLNHQVFAKLRTSLYRDNFNCTELTMKKYSGFLFNSPPEKEKFITRNKLLERILFELEDVYYQADVIFHAMSLLEKIIQDPELYKNFVQGNDVLYSQIPTISSGYLHGYYAPDNVFYLPSDPLDEGLDQRVDDFYINSVALLNKLKCRVDFSTIYNVLMLKIRKNNGILDISRQRFNNLSTLLLFVSCVTYNLNVFGVDEIIEFVTCVIDPKRWDNRQYVKEFRDMFEESISDSYSSLLPRFNHLSKLLTKNISYEKAMRMLI